MKDELPTALNNVEVTWIV